MATSIQLAETIFSDEKDNIRSEVEDVLGRLRKRVDEAIETLRDDFAACEQSEIDEAIARLDEEISYALTTACRECSF